MKLRTNTVLICTLILMACLTLTLAGCDEVSYGRNAIAAAKGAIEQAQQEYLADCSANPTLAECRTINDAVRLHTTAVIGMETYCGFELNKPLPDPSAKCTPVKSAAAGLKVTVSNLEALVGQIQAMVAAHKAKRASLAFPKCSHPDGHCWEDNIPPPLAPMKGQIPLDPQVIALAIGGLKLLIDAITSGKLKDVADETVQAVEGALSELQSHQSAEVTFGELESLKLKELWPDSPATSAPTTPSA